MVASCSGDFGTGRALEETAALDGHLAGTPLYLAPEVLEGRPATPHSDQYSLGVLLYHLVTGSYPVRGRTVAEIRLAHAHGDRTAIAERLPDAPRRFTDIVDRVIDPDPTRRYEGIEELGGALTAFVGVESTSLLAPDVDTPMRKTSRRWWLAGSLAAGLIVTAGVLLQLRTNATGDPPGSVPAPTSLTVRRITAGAVPMRPTHDFRHFGCTDRETQDLALCELFDDDFRQIRRITNRGASRDDARYFWGAFSPNGLEVAYTAEGPDGVQEARIIGIDGAGHRLLRRGFEGVAFVSLLSWTDPDEILAFLDLPDKSAELVFLSVTDGSIQSILQLATNSSAKDLGFVQRSPDGRYLLHTPLAQGTTQRDIVVLDLESGRETMVVAHPASDGAAIWLPDGSGILFNSNRLGTMGLWRLEVRGGQSRGAPTLVRDMGRTALNPIGFASDGSLYYWIKSEPADVFGAVLNANPETPLVTTRLPTGLRTNVSPAWSSDGRHLAYLSEPLGDSVGASVVVQDAATEREREFLLEPLDVWRDAKLRWLPDDSALGLLVISKVDYTERLRVLDPDTGQVIRERSLGSIRERGEVWDFDWLTNDVIVFLRLRQIVVLDLETGLEHLAYANDDARIAAMRLSPDRALVALTTGGDGTVSLSVMPATGGELRVVYQGRVEFVGRMKGHDWSADGRQLFFTRRDTPSLLPGQRPPSTSVARRRRERRGGSSQSVDRRIARR